MNDTILSTTAVCVPADSVPSDLDAAILRLFVEIDQSLEQMQRDQAEIETLKAETRTLQTETEAMLTSLKAMF